MRALFRLGGLVGLGLLLGASAACSHRAAALAPTQPVPAVTEISAPAAPRLVSPAATQTSAAAPTPTAAPRATPLLSATPCAPDLCVFSSPFVLARPIAPPGRDMVDISYRFGSTQGHKRDPHHGVEFVNSSGTPVLTAADGLVVVAGDDRRTFYGPYSDFYGNLVVIEHHLPGFDLPVYTLYGHLSQLSVQPGEEVKAGQEVGKVGMSGVATGSHLHFEVRYGNNTYASSRNPELWLQPHLDEQGIPNGALAGRIIGTYGQDVAGIDLVIARLPAPDQPSDQEYYLSLYEEKALIGQPPYQESFALGDLPPGWYRITFIMSRVWDKVVQVYPGQLTRVVFDLRAGQ